MKASLRIAITLGLAVLFLELLLQGGACIAHQGGRDGRASEVGTGAAVLCIGDSFTYGLGSSSSASSYPGALEALLRAAGRPELRVHNCGWSGQNSRDVLERLDAQLAHFTPDVTVVLVGLNDSWSRPERLLAEDLAAIPARAVDDTWRWRFRTGRLVLWALGGDSAQGPPAESIADVPHDINFEGALGMIGKRPTEEVLSGFRRALENDPEKQASCRLGLVQLLAPLGRRDEIEVHLEALRDLWNTGPSAQVAEALVYAHAAAGEYEQSEAFARETLTRYPNSSQLHWIEATGYYRAGQLALSVASYQHALENAGGDSAWRAILLRGLASAEGADEPRSAVRHLVEALNTDGDLGRSNVVLQGVTPGFEPALVEEVLRAMPLTPPQTASARRLFRLDEAGATSASVSSTSRSVLELHLRLVAERCRQAGSVPVFLTYPNPQPDVNAALQKQGAALGVRVVSVRQRFDEALTTHTREELFIPDGHCNDRGYALLASEAQAAVEAALSE